ncbi:MAG TPA: tetratricopeptide repeat protein [Acidimicrobiales bacterium]|nr:tetratricopeptide repeat protein [Acidimicrobiales bacterium]
MRAGSLTGLALLDDAVEDLVGLRGDPVARVEAAVAADEGMVLGHVLAAYLSLYATSTTGVAEAKKLLREAEGEGAVTDERELLHLRAARSWADGEWEAAARALERALLHNPRDLLALKVAQDLYFSLGNRLDLRGVVARVLPAWPLDRPGWGYVQGMYAFGLEENAEYLQAEWRARDALDRNPKDVWAVHALAHVFEMEGDQESGIQFLTESEADWAGSYFAVHNWWHRALYHLEVGEIDQVRALYDGPIRGQGPTEWLDAADAASLLWRLSLFGVDLAGRADQLASDVDRLIDDPVHVFNDWHAVMALGLAGRHQAAAGLLSANRRKASGTNRRVVDQVGLDLLEGFTAFARGDAVGALDRLIDVRPRAHLVGGSHAQRDVIDLTLIAAAARAGDHPLARALVAERVARKPAALAAADRLLQANG